MSLQVHIFRAITTAPSTSATNYGSAINGQTWTATEHRGTCICTAAGTFSNFSVALAAAPGVGKSYTYTLRKNGIDTAAAVTISGTALTGVYTGTPIALAVDDEITIKCVPSGTPASARPMIAWDFNSTTAGESIYGAGNDAGVIAANRSNAVLVPAEIINWNASQNRDVVACAGNLTRATIKLDASVGSGSITFTIEKNGVNQDGTGGTPDTRITFTTGITKASASFSLALSPGDRLLWNAVRTGSPASVRPIVGARLTATTPGESHFGGGIHAVYIPAGTVYVLPTAAQAAGDATELTRSVTVGPTGFVLRNLRVVLSGTAGTSGVDGYIYTLRQNSSSASNTVSLLGSVSSGSNSSTTTVAAADQITLQVVPTGSATARASNWSFVQASVLPAVVETLAASAVAGTTATLNGQILPNGTAMAGRFAWGLSAGALTNETTPEALGAGLAYVPFEAALTGLDPSTTYYFRAIGDDGTDDTLGDVLSFTTLPEQTFEDGAVSHPLTWITLTKKDGVKEPYAEVDLNDPEDYYDGYKRPRVERFLPIARGLSDRDGQVEHMTFGAVLSDIRTDRDDPDRPFRGMLADPVNQYLTNRPLEVWFIDDTERRRLGLARLAAVGYVNDYAPVADLKFDVKGGDWLKKKFSRKRRAQQSWQPLITAADFPACPVETLNTAAPLIYGSLGVGGADAVLNVAVTVNPQPTAAPGSFALSLQAGGRTAGITRYYKVSAMVGGVESIQAGPLVATTTDTNKTIRLTWAAVPSATAYYVYSSRRADFYQGAMLTLGSGVLTYDDTTVLPNENPEWITGTNWKLMERINLSYHVYANLGGGLFSLPGIGYTVIAPIPYGQIGSESLLTRDIDVTWTAHAGATGGYRIVRRRSYYSDWNAVFDRQWDVAAGVLTVTDDLVTTSAVTVPAGELIAVAAAGQAEAVFLGRGAYGTSPITVSALLVARHACARLGAIYIPQTTTGVDGETATTYARVPDDQYGVTWFAPDHAGWIYPTKYVDINGRRYTLIFTTVEPLPDKVLVDVDGIETAADGTGTLIRSIVDQRFHFMVNFVAPDTPWESGAYLTADDTVFPHVPTIPLVDEDSHAAVKASLAARLEGVDYEGAVIIGAAGEFVTAADALAWFQVSGDFDQAFNRKGQDTISCEPLEASDDLPEITDVLSIKEGSLSLIDQVTTAFFNILPYVHSRDYTGREPSGWYGNAEARSDDSITNYDQERESPKFELHACRANTPAGAATVADVMARKLARYQDPRRTGTLTMAFEGLNYEPGASVLITSIEGIGPAGWSGREVRITRHEVDPTDGTVRLDFYDLTAVFANLEALRRRRAGLNSDGRHR